MTDSSQNQFEGIQIVGLDETQTYNPDPTKLLYHVYLSLSAYPSSAWSKIFQGERQFPRHSMWRRAWVEGDHIVVHAVLEEIEKYHLADLKEDVKNTNANYQQYLVAQAQAQENRKAAEERERDQVKNLKNRLTFD